MKPARYIQFLLLLVLLAGAASCVREPDLHLHAEEAADFDMPTIDLRLDVFWAYDDAYDYRREWYYGWDERDRELFGDSIGYTEPHRFEVRRYYTYDDPRAPHSEVREHQVDGHTLRTDFDWGFWDLLAWNRIQTIDGLQSLVFDEQTTLDSVLATTGPSLQPSRYNAPAHTRAYYQPEALFAAYLEDVDINRSMEGFTYDPATHRYHRTIPLLLRPVTYIYLTQVILHHNRGRIASCDGTADLSSMARATCLNTQRAAREPVTVYYNVRLKTHCQMQGEDVDIVGGRLMTFGLPGLDPRAHAAPPPAARHYIDVCLQFNNGNDSTFVFDVTDQVRRRYLGGVVTVELDMDTIPPPGRRGGSAFDAVVRDYEDGGTHEFEM